jgi:hypothetical protein
VILSPHGPVPLAMPVYRGPGLCLIGFQSDCTHVPPGRDLLHGQQTRTAEADDLDDLQAGCQCGNMPSYVGQRISIPTVDSVRTASG